MDNLVPKILAILAGIILILLLISKVFGLWDTAEQGVDNAVNEIDKLNARLETAAYTDVDGRSDVSGATVLTFISEHKNDGTSITVKNGTSTISITAALTEQQKNQAISSAKNKNLGTYIKPSSAYTAAVTYNTDGTIQGITFTRN